jgi:hypothetical protein
MAKIVTLKLPRLFVGQLLDCLNIAVEDWDRTKLYHETGYVDPDEQYVRECNDAHEAEQIANYYRQIIAEIEKQLDNQKQYMKKKIALQDADDILKFLNDEIQTVQNDLLQKEYEAMILKLERLIRWIEIRPASER